MGVEVGLQRGKGPEPFVGWIFAIRLCITLIPKLGGGKGLGLGEIRHDCGGDCGAGCGCCAARKRLMQKMVGPLALILVILDADPSLQPTNHSDSPTPGNTHSKPRAI